MVNIEKHQERKLLIRKGSFKCAHPYEMVFVTGIMIAEAFFAVYWFFAAGIPSAIVEPDMLEAKLVFYALVMSGISFVMAIFFALATIGRSCEYSAEESEFVITGPGKRKEYFYYNDVHSVDSVPLKLLGRKRGYLITIETGVRTVTYRYIFTDKKVLTEFEDTPFYFLAVNSGLMQYEERLSGITAEQVAAMFVQRGNEQLAEEQRSRSSGEPSDIAHEFFNFLSGGNDD